MNLHLSETNPTKANVLDLPEQELIVSKTGEKLTLAKSLADAFGLTNLLVHQEVLLPGRRASSFHFHSEKEEIFYVLAGTSSLLVGEEITDLYPGDFIGFKPSEHAPHMLFNRSSEPATVLTIGTCPPADEVTNLQQDAFVPALETA